MENDSDYIDLQVSIFQFISSYKVHTYLRASDLKRGSIEPLEPPLAMGLMSHQRFTRLLALVLFT